MSTYRIQGAAELSRQLKELSDVKKQAAVLRAAVREPMLQVEKKAKANLARISPGETPLHRTYKGRIVSAGFAQRSVRTIVRMDRAKTMAQAVLGVRKEAFYVLQFFELGTVYIKSIPWLQPAFFQSRYATLRKVGEVMRERIERIAQGRGGAR